MEDRKVLYREDIITMSEFIKDSIMEVFEDPDKKRKEYYIKILETMADSMLHDDGIVIEDGWFERQHGV